MIITIPYDIIDAQSNSEPSTDKPSSNESKSLQNLDSQNKLLTKINEAEDPWNLAINPETNMVYVTHAGSDKVSVINGITNELLDSFQVRGTKGQVAVNPETNMVYVAVDDNSTATVHVIDGSTNNVVSNVAIQNSPVHIAVNPATNMVYLTHIGNIISVIEGHTNKVYEMTVVNHPSKVAINPETNMVYVVSVFSNEISVINGTNNRVVTTITTPIKLHDIDLNPETNMVYVTNDGANRISVIDGKTNEVIKTIVSNFTDYRDTTLAVDTGTNLVYAVTSSNTLSAIDGETNNIVNNLMLDVNDLHDLAINPETNRIYISSKMNDVISVIDGKRDTILTDQQGSLVDREIPGIKVARNPIDIAVNQETNRIYTIYSASNIVSMIDGDTDTIIDTIALGTPPSGIDVNPFTNMIYLISRDHNSVIAIDGATNTIISNITLSGVPRDLAVNPQTNMIYTHNRGPFSGGESISAIDGATNTEVDNINVGRTSNLAVDTNTDTIYVPSTINNSLTTITGLSSEIRRATGIDVFSGGNVGLIKQMSGLPIIFPGFDVKAVNPNTNLLYIVDNSGQRVSEVDSYTGTVLNNFTILGSVTDIAVNPQANMVYVTDGTSDTVSIINSTAGARVGNLSVGAGPLALAVNPETNMIYVASTGSSTISVINGHTDKVIAAVTFNVDPSNAGFIECNGQTISDNHTAMYDTATSIECEAKANGGFQFSSWSGDLISSTSDSNPKMIFTPSKYGALSANFINLTQITVPWELLAGIILAPIVGWLVPFVADRARESKQSKKLAEFMMKNIDDELSKPHQNIVEYQERLKELRMKIQEMYTEGKISASTHERLNNKVSEYGDRNV